MKKRFLFSTLAALFALSCSVFTSCSDDDDDDDAKLEFTINGNAIADKGVATLGKSTVDPSESGDTITLVITSDKEFSAVDLCVKNSWANNVTVVDVNGKAHNGLSTDAPANSKTIKFVGILGQYTMKVAGETFSFKLEDKDGEGDYVGNSRYLSNKQTVIFDATEALYSKTNFGMTYTNNKTDEIRNLDGNLATISEELYEKASTDLSKAEFGKKAEGEDMTYSTKKNIGSTPAYYIYKTKDAFYLVKVVSITSNGNILTAEIQY